MNIKTYETVQGDTWDSIAFKFYNDENYADELMKANPDKIEWFVFEAGVVLNIPDIMYIEAKRLESAFPEWRTFETVEEMDYGE